MLTVAERQRRYRERRLAAADLLPKVACLCGCGTMLRALDTNLRPARYAHGHNPRDPKTLLTSERVAEMNRARKGLPAPWLRGFKRSAETIARRQETRLKNNDGLYQTKGGWTHPPETRARMKASNAMRGKKGPLNHFFGRKHSEETRAMISAKLSGSLNPGWAGGVGVLPYGPEFTRKLKRQILKRDGHRCQRCGNHQSELRHKLQVHHLDHDKTNNDLANLAASCCSCNVWASYHRDKPFKV